MMPECNQHVALSFWEHSGSSVRLPTSTQQFELLGYWGKHITFTFTVLLL